ncbi:MAG: hypothetical protein CUN52_00100 [Phototrophicales bacterium]|nr:MAG: hypothetical protein CUN52_00100 [Phototrophicales bacterium]
MSATYDKLKALLDTQKSLSDEDITKAITESGEMTDEEKMKLEADRLEVAKSTATGVVTMEQYLEACKVLDTAEEGSEEYKKAEALVEQYEKGQ